MIRCFVTVLSLLPAIVAGAAGPAFWDSPELVPFTDGELRGAGLDARGSLVPGLVAETLLADSSLVFWSVAGADEMLWAGSGHEGRVWRLNRRGDASLLADLPAEEVFTVLADGDGVIVGCGPGGQLYAIDGEGQSTALGAIPGGYAWDLERAPDGTVYIAAGSPAAVYRLAGEGPELVTELPASNALDLAVLDDGTLLVASQGPGRVFHVEPGPRRWALVLAMEQDEGRQVLRGPDGWYALGYQGEDGHGGQSGNGRQSMDFDNPFDIMVTADADVQPVRAALYKLDGGAPHRVWTSEYILTSVVWSADHGWLGAGSREEAGPTVIYALEAPNGRRPVGTFEGGDVVDLAVHERAGKTDEILVAQAHPGRITRLRTAGKNEAEALGPPLDGKLPVRWARLTWRGPAGGSEPRFAVRTGMSPSPDDSWTEWRTLGKGRDLDLADLPPARCLQWRATLAPGSRVDAVTVSAVEPNLAPAITHFTVQPDGQIYQGGMMQPPGNATQSFRDGLQVEYSTQSRDDRRLDRDRAGSLRPLRALTWHASDPNEDRLAFRLFYRREGDQDWRTLDGPTREQVRSWDTAGLPDGWYDVRLIASDLLDNPADEARTAEKVIGPVPVDNTPPVLSDWQLTHERDGFRIDLRAEDAFGPLAGAEVELPDGSVERLDPRDGVCDAAREIFAATVPYPRPWNQTAPRPWRVRVRVWDLRGNVAHVEGMLP